MTAASPGGEGCTAILDAYRGCGGIACGDDLVQLFEERLCGDYVSLARLLAGHDAFGFRCRQTLWIPMFQFDSQDLSVRPGPRRVVERLSAAFDAWQMANWFVAPHAGLMDGRPIEMIDIELDRVLDLASADIRAGCVEVLDPCGPPACGASPDLPCQRSKTT